MDFRMLGPLEVWNQDERVVVSGRHAPKALVMLLDEPGRVVPVHQLVDAIWGEEPPRTACQQIHKIVSGLRRVLGEARLTTVSGGYRLEAEPGEVDVLRSRAAETRAREARVSGDLEGARKAVLEALAEWRGPALVDIASEVANSIADRLDEYRLTLVELRMDLELELGGHAEVLAELRELMADHPYREVFASQLMLAQYRCGLAPEALRLFADVAARIADELGVDPGRPLRDLHSAILREDPSLNLEVAKPEPTPPQPLPRPEPIAVPERPSRASARLLALSLAALVIGMGATGADRDRLQPNSEPVGKHGATDLDEPLWTYPALDSNSAVMMVDAGLLVLDGPELRLEADGEVLWSEHMDSQSTSDVAVTADTVVLTSGYLGDVPWNIGGVTALEIDTGAELWRMWDRWPVFISDEAVVTIGCAQSPSGATTGCSMHSVQPHTGITQWLVDLDDRSFPLNSDTPYDSPWTQNPSSEYLLIRSYSDDGAKHRLSVYDLDTGALLSEFADDGIEAAEISDGLLLIHKGSTFVAEGHCEARIAAYDVHSAELRWERFVDNEAYDDQRCRPLPTLQGAKGLFPVTLGDSASVIWLRNGELHWTPTEPASAELIEGDFLVTSDDASDTIAVWDLRSHEKRWTAPKGDLMWSRGTTLWILDRTAITPTCGGLLAYDLTTGTAHCLPGSLVYLTEDTIITATNGTWQAWPTNLTPQ